MKPDADPSRPLIVHVVYGFGVGGLENGIVNLLNNLPAEAARHCVLALDRIDERFAQRIRRSDIELIALHKPPGQTLKLLPRVTRLFRKIRPAVVHTRNSATLECQLAAWVARVPVRIHGEHGWDVADLHGANTRLRFLRRSMRRFVHHQVALSERTRQYLIEEVGVAPEGVSALTNGVDTERFQPLASRPGALPEGWPFPPGAFVVGTVGRLAKVKNQALLCEAFAICRARNPAFARDARLLLVGDGPEVASLRALVDQLGCADVTWFAGEREDIPALLAHLHVFCLPSLAEGISNSILEAMASGVPVVATAVGGNPELVVPGETGCLIGDQDREALANAIANYFTDPALRAAHASAGRERTVRNFSLLSMASNYHRLYESLLRRNTRPR